MKPSEDTSSKIRAIRKRAGLSQQQVAEALGIDRSAYTYFENGDTDVKLERLIRVSRMFDIGVDELIDPQYLSPALAQMRHIEPVKMYAVDKNEKGLLAMYRQLSPEQKEKLLAQIKNECKDV